MMKADRPSIFRTSALDYYVRSREQIVLPRLLAPTFFKFLWGTLAMLLFASGAALFSNIPGYVPATAVVVSDPRYGRGLLLLIKPEDIANVEVGQTVRLPNSGQATIVHIEPSTRSSQAIQSEFNLTLMDIRGPVATALATADNDPVLWADMVYPVQIEAGSRRLINLLPLFEGFQ
jgi:hypothetical protein